MGPTVGQRSHTLARRPSRTLSADRMATSPSFIEHCIVRVDSYSSPLPQNSLVPTPHSCMLFASRFWGRESIHIRPLSPRTHWCQHRTTACFSRQVLGGQRGGRRRRELQKINATPHLNRSRSRGEIRNQIRAGGQSTNSVTRETKSTVRTSRTCGASPFELPFERLHPSYRANSTRGAREPEPDQQLRSAVKIVSYSAGGGNPGCPPVPLGSRDLLGNNCTVRYRTTAPRIARGHDRGRARGYSCLSGPLTLTLSPPVP